MFWIEIACRKRDARRFAAKGFRANQRRWEAFPKGARMDNMKAMLSAKEGDEHRLGRILPRGVPCIGWHGLGVLGTPTMFACDGKTLATVGCMEGADEDEPRMAVHLNADGTVDEADQSLLGPFQHVFVEAVKLICEQEASA